ncbi:hypothetical protein A6U85_32395 [Agrobacterium sp. 13-626]|nr:hypothetical protein A6U85_32395 [Agrobacterium sp. 13-626]
MTMLPAAWILASAVCVASPAVTSEAEIVTLPPVEAILTPVWPETNDPSAVVVASLAFFEPYLLDDEAVSVASPMVTSPLALRVAVPPLASISEPMTLISPLSAWTVTLPFCEVIDEPLLAVAGSTIAAEVDQLAGPAEAHHWRFRSPIKWPTHPNSILRKFVSHKRCKPPI